MSPRSRRHFSLVSDARDAFFVQYIDNIFFPSLVARKVGGDTDTL